MGLEALRAYSITRERMNKLVHAIKTGTYRNMEMNGRGVVFLTQKCNFKCLYCKSRDPAITFKTENLLPVLKEWAQRGCKYLHLTGGEPTIHPDIVEIVKAASAVNMAVSMSTNGFASPGLYNTLIRNGLRYLYISFDSFDESRFDSIAGIKGAFTRVISSIREITALRDSHNAGIYVTLNIILCEENFGQVEKLIEKTVLLKPDDFKLIPTTGFIAALKGPGKRRLMKLISMNAQLKERYPFFFYRLNHLTEMRGLMGAEFRDIRCYISLDERTFDNTHYFPCAIYKRENGPPLGTIDEPYEKQAKKLYKFLWTTRAGQDPLCRKYCCDITRDFNLAVHKLLHTGNPG